MEKEVIEAEDVEAICANQINGKIFDMVEAIGRKESKKALDLYYDLLMLKEPAMRILFLVTRHFQILMQLRDMMGGGFDYKSMLPKSVCRNLPCVNMPDRQELLKESGWSRLCGNVCRPKKISKPDRWQISLPWNC